MVLSIVLTSVIALAWLEPEWLGRLIAKIVKGYHVEMQERGDE